MKIASVSLPGVKLAPDLNYPNEVSGSYGYRLLSFDGTANGSDLVTALELEGRYALTLLELNALTSGTGMHQIKLSIDGELIYNSGDARTAYQSSRLSLLGSKAAEGFGSSSPVVIIEKSLKFEYWHASDTSVQLHYNARAIK